MSTREQKLSEAYALLEKINDNEVIAVCSILETAIQTRNANKANKTLPFRGAYEFAEEMIAEKGVKQ